MFVSFFFGFLFPHPLFFLLFRLLYAKFVGPLDGTLLSSTHHTSKQASPIVGLIRLNLLFDMFRFFRRVFVIFVF